MIHSPFTMPLPPEHLRPLVGDVLGGRYRLDAVVGRGGGGVLFLACDLVAAGPPVVAKVLAPEHRRNPEIRAQFGRELQALGQIKSDFVVRLLDQGEPDADAPWFVMERLGGRSLREHMASGAAPTLQNVRALLRQLSQGLSDIQGAGWLHLDVDPSNIMVVGVDPLRIRVIDLGAAVSRSASLLERMNQYRFFKRGYVAPEEATPPGATEATDVYKAGLTVLEFAFARSGQAPRPNANGAAWPPDVRRAIPWLDAATADLLRQMLAWGAVDRIPSASKLFQAAQRLPPVRPDAGGLVPANPSEGEDQEVLEVDDCDVIAVEPLTGHDVKAPVAPATRPQPGLTHLMDWAVYVALALVSGWLTGFLLG